MDPFNGQQMPQINNDTNSGQRNDIYVTDLRGYPSPPYSQQMRRPTNSVYNSTNNPMSDQINELTKQTNMMSFGPNEVNYHSIGGGDISNNTRGWIQPDMKEQSPQSSMMNPGMVSNLSPFAKEFVPRSTMSFSSGPSVTNGMNWNQSVPEVNADCDDFIALSYLKEFIDTITIKPNKFETGIIYLTEVLNAYIDEDESIMDSVVNLIVDQAIIEPQFRYNGVRLCINLIQNLVVSEEREFKFLLFRRCEREYSRREHLNKASATTEQYLRGLTMFIGDLYSRLESSELAQFLPQLLLTLLSKPEKENLKCVCQVLKLCGQLLERNFNETKTDDMRKVMDRMQVCITEKDINQYVKELMTNILEMQKRGWTANIPAAENASNHVVNPYLDATPESNWGDYTEEFPNYSDEDELQLARYDFGQCGDEEDNEVCEAFEQFLKNSGQTK